MTKKLRKPCNLNEKYMKIAFAEAQKARQNGDVPVGAVIVKDGKIVARAHNQREKQQNAIFHAEILAISKACKKLRDFRLENCEMFVTLEPCPMCSGAIVFSRIKKLIFACKDENYGCAGSVQNILQNKAFEHVVQVENGIFEKECKQLLQQFFAEIRTKNKLKKLVGKEVDCQMQNGSIQILGLNEVKVVALSPVGQKAMCVAFVENTKTFEKWLIVATKDVCAKQIASTLNEINLKITTKTEVLRT